MTPKKIETNRKFIGRDFEKTYLSEIGHSKEASILVVYGRRRIGKTELIEQTFRNRKILKFEGVEGLSQEEQIHRAILQLAIYNNDALLSKVKISTWMEFFKILFDLLPSGIWTLFFEEIQWLACYKNQFIAELKHAWDNYFRHHSKLTLVLCGSSPSFIIHQVLHSKSLYNRSQHEVSLQEFSLYEAKQFLKKKSQGEIMQAYLTVGGIPEYLKWLQQESSVFLSLCRFSFSRGGFFSKEYQRIFTSSLSENKNYKKIIEFLSQRKFATRNQILEHLKLGSGGTLTSVLEDLELCGFINKITPFHKQDSRLLVRYHISDAYLHFYFQFIKPLTKDIELGKYNKNPSFPLNRDRYQKWLGFAFERFCRKNHHIFAKILGFEGIHYQAGAFFNRATDQENPGYQLDLVFDREDQVCTLCEIKYYQTEVSPKIIKEFETKLELFPNPKKKTIQKVLITTEGASPSLTKKAYFDRVINLKEIFQKKYWE